MQYPSRLYGICGSHKLVTWMVHRSLKIDQTKKKKLEKEGVSQLFFRAPNFKPLPNKKSLPPSDFV